MFFKYYSREFKTGVGVQPHHVVAVAVSSAVLSAAVVAFAPKQSYKLYKWLKNERVTTQEDREQIREAIEDAEDVEEVDEEQDQPYEYEHLTVASGGTLEDRYERIAQYANELRLKSRLEELTGAVTLFTGLKAPIGGASDAQVLNTRNTRRLKGSFRRWLTIQVRLRFCTTAPPMRDAATEKAMALFIRRICTERKVRPVHVNMLIPSVIEMAFIPTRTQLIAQEYRRHPLTRGRLNAFQTPITHHQTWPEYLKSLLRTERGREMSRE